MILLIYHRYEFLNQINSENAVFSDVAPCIASVFIYPEDGGDMFLRNIGLHNIYKAPHPRRRHSS
jgi:hypothetical protein